MKELARPSSLIAAGCASRHGSLIAAGCASRHVIHIADVFVGAFLRNATPVIITRNQPSGDPTPSAEGIVTTAALKSAGGLPGIELVDRRLRAPSKA